MRELQQMIGGVLLVAVTSCSGRNPEPGAITGTVTFTSGGEYDHSCWTTLSSVQVPVSAVAPQAAADGPYHWRGLSPAPYTVWLYQGDLSTSGTITVTAVLDIEIEG